MICNWLVTNWPTHQTTHPPTHQLKVLEDDVPLNAIRCLICLCDLFVIQVDWHSRLCLRNLFPSLQISFQILSNPVKYQAIAIFQILREIAFEKNCFGEHSCLQSLIGFHLLSKYYFLMKITFNTFSWKKSTSVVASTMKEKQVVKDLLLFRPAI